MGKEFNATLQQYAMNVLSNTLSDTSDRSLVQKVGRAALTSLPETITINTKPAVNYVANRYPVLELEGTKRPSNEIEMSKQATRMVDENNRLIIAYHEKKK